MSHVSGACTCACTDHVEPLSSEMSTPALPSPRSSLRTVNAGVEQLKEAKEATCAAAGRRRNALELFVRQQGSSARARCHGSRLRETAGVLSRLPGLPRTEPDSPHHHGAGMRAAAAHLHAGPKPSRALSRQKGKIQSPFARTRSLLAVTCNATRPGKSAGAWACSARANTRLPSAVPSGCPGPPPTRTRAAVVPMSP
jgi:hypothetical protein